jgi:predicted double-glycine peptidase
MALRSFLYAHPEYEQHLLRLSDDYVYFVTWEAPLAVLMIFGLAARLPAVDAAGRRVRRLILISTVLLAPLFLQHSVASCLQPRYNMAARFDPEGICRQATSFSCGPAAGVTLARMAGRRVSEGEMARLCLLRPGRGVTALELRRGLDIALRAVGRRARLQRVDDAGLAHLPPPFLAQLRREERPEHCVVVLQCSGGTVVLGDPAAGLRRVTLDWFLERWTGLVVTVSPELDDAIAGLPGDAGSR